MQPAVNGTDERLDVLIAKFDELLVVLTPRQPPRPEGTVALREPAADPPARPQQPPRQGKRRR